MNASLKPKGQDLGRAWSGFSVGLLTFAAISIALGAPVYSAEVPIFAPIVKVRSEVPPSARTSRSLGTEREGSGVVIDSNGLVLTIGYLILEAMRAEVVGPSGKPVNAKIVGYDHNTGFGLLRVSKPLRVTPMKLGESAELRERDEVLVASYGGSESVQGAFVISRRDFAGYWEYLLENAIFTAPPYNNYGGAALIGRGGRLLGIGSLIVQDAIPGRDEIPGNMFVPIDKLKPILADLITRGRSSEPPRPWLGMFSQAVAGRILVHRVSSGSPADQAGIRPNDIIVGVAGKEVTGLADYYRKVWSLGYAGIDVPLNVLQGTRVRDLVVHSADRYKYLRLNPSH
jgi:S1-C subfamily serine protease